MPNLLTARGPLALGPSVEEEPLLRGDEVEFELRPRAHGGADVYPRFEGELDRGTSGVFWRGYVTEITDDGDVFVTYDNPRDGRSEVWMFPASGFGNHYAGWVRKARAPTTPVCECGSMKVYGGGPHSHWCPMFVC